MKELIEKLKIGIDLLIEKDSFLLTNNSNERSVSHKLAEYLQQLFPNYNVDCEYNRHFSNPKRGNIGNNPLILPDIIIHKRGSDHDNLIVIEIKTRNRFIGDKKISFFYDHRKLKMFTRKKRNDNEFGYKFGFFINFLEFNRTGNVKVIPFREGKEEYYNKINLNF